jgi:hypothetical protein
VNLRWKAFERGLDRRIRNEVRTSARLRQEYQHLRRGRRWWNLRISPGTYRLIFWFIALNYIALGRLAIEQAMAIIWLWAMGAAFWQAGRLQSALYFAAELNLFHHLPISDGEIFHVQWRKFLRGMIWPALDFVVLYGALAYRMGAGWQSPVVGLGFGSLQGLFVAGIATNLLGFGFRNRLPYAALLFYTSGIGILFFGGRMPEVVSWLSAAAYWIPPAGWIQYALGVSVSRGAGTDWIPSLLAGAVLAVYPIAQRRLHQGYKLSEAVFARAFRFTATGEAASLRLAEYGEQFAQPPEDASASVKARAFLDQLDWRKAGLVERIVSGVLTERERTIAEFLTAANPGWTKSFRTLVVLGGVLFIAVRVFPIQFASGILIITSVAAVLFMGAGNRVWRGFGPSAAVGLPPPFYTFYPLSFAELHCAVMKILLVRYLLLLPFLAGAVVLFATTLKLKTELAFLPGLKLIMVGIAAPPILAIIPFSSSSNDSDQFRFAIPAALYGLLTIACGAVFVLSQDILISSSAGVVGAFCCWLAPWFYGRRFNRSKFDLLPSTRNGTSTPMLHG